METEQTTQSAVKPTQVTPELLLAYNQVMEKYNRLDMEAEEFKKQLVEELKRSLEGSPIPRATLNTMIHAKKGEIVRAEKSELGLEETMDLISRINNATNKWNELFA